MNIDRIAHIASALALGALVQSGALAQAPSTAAPAPGQMGYLNGGIGEEQADLMRDMSSQFPVRFTFSRHNGTHNTDEFLADIRLRVVDSAGQTVLNLSQQGPIFLLRLPEGTYAVEAEHNGEVKSRRFQVIANRHQEIAFSWAG